MNRLISVLVVISICSAVTARQENGQSNAPVAALDQAATQMNQQAAAVDAEFTGKPPFKLANETTAVKILSRQRPPVDYTIVKGGPKLVFKEGALYLDVLGDGGLVPVPGGGASGCFGPNLQARIEKLRTVIEGLPPRPTFVPPR